ncbi:MAG: hypothetical protein LBQ54_00420, partial [Planctomycetaceae bacterium]|nr:hypothetical protein [Planctomycetaceae bacterium]
ESRKMITETDFGLKEYRVRNLFFSRILKRCLRRAATPRRADGAAAPKAMNPFALLTGVCERKHDSTGGRRHTAVKQHASLRRPTQGRWIPVCSRPLRGGRFQMENLSNEEVRGSVFLSEDISEQRERVIASGRESHPGSNVRTLAAAARGYCKMF